MLSGALLAATAALGAPAPAGATPAVANRLPRVTLSTRRRIRDDPKTAARVRVSGGAGGGYAGRGAIELRGQSSQSFPKKSYGLELRTRAGADRDAGLLGLPLDADWVLYAAYNDKSLVRNAVAYETARRMGRWAAGTRFVELRLNGRYEGIYVLMERPELSSLRIDVPGKGLTGDYLFEFTFDYQARRKGQFFRTPIKRRPILHEDPERADLSPRESTYARGVVNGAERRLYRGGRGAWRRVLDPAAAVDFVLMQELFRNVDAFHGSTYMVKSAGTKLALGPVWDFDLSSGNSTAGRSRYLRGWYTRQRDWAERLHADPTFRSAIRSRWRELRADGLREAVLRSVDRHAREVRPAVGRNFRRWPVLDRRVFQNPAARGSHTAEVRFLRSWLSKRMSWLDSATRPR